MRRVIQLGIAIGIVGTALPVGAVQWMHWPVDRTESSQRYVTQGFYGDYIGYCCSSGTNCRNGCGTHNGYDYGIVSGTPLYAVAPGVVDAIHATDTRGDYGNAGLYVRIRHDGTTVGALGNEVYFSAYLHMSRIDVAVGQAVDTQTVIGLSGASGGVAAHLHLHIHGAGAGPYCQQAVDPGCPTAPYVAGSVIPGFAGAPGCQSQCDANLKMWIEPAQYGGEPYAGCEGLDYLGLCEGSVLRWCEGGMPKEVDCAADERVCVYEDDTIGWNCKPCGDLGLPACAADNLTHSRCEAGTVVTDDCMFGCDPATGCLPEPGAEPSPTDVGSGTPDMGGARDVGAGGGFADVGSDLGSDADAAPGPVVVRGEGCCRTAGSAPGERSWLLALVTMLGAAVYRRRLSRRT